jgi:uncharacterized membrane protein
MGWQWSASLAWNRYLAWSPVSRTFARPMGKAIVQVSAWHVYAIIR